VWVVAQLIGHRPVRLFGGLVYLTHIRNSGAAFSLGAGLTVAISLIAVIVVGYVLWLSHRLVSARWAVALGLIAGGALGNLIDRLFRTPGPLRGGVVDFISLADPVNPPWPVFNLADSALVIGVVIVVALELFGSTRPFASVSGADDDTSPAPSSPERVDP
jgi:signal peptidase II